jgi:hypothetical protein
MGTVLTVEAGERCAAVDPALEIFRAIGRRRLRRLDGFLHQGDRRQDHDRARVVRRRAAESFGRGQHGAGPDLFWGLYSCRTCFPQKCLDVSDVADYLGKKYGGWVPTAVTYGKGTGNKWIAIPVCYAGNLLNYRIEASKKAGFSKFPTTTDEFLAYAKAMKAQGTPGGMALGHASGDGNAWVYWCLWAFGGNVVDKSDKVIISSPETEKALNYAKALYENYIPGTASWNDSFNNKAFLGRRSPLDQQRHLHLRRGAERCEQEADRRGHGSCALAGGAVGKPTEFHLLFPLMAMTYTKYPQACKALMAYMLEADQFNKWLTASRGYLTHCLNALRFKPGVDRRQEDNAVPRCRQAHIDGGRPRLGRRESGKRDCRFRRARHVRGGLHRARRSKRRDQDRRSSAAANLSVSTSRPLARPLKQKRHGRSIPAMTITTSG